MSLFEKSIVVLCVVALLVLSACAIYRDFNSLPGCQWVCPCRCHDQKPDDHKPKPKPGIGEGLLP